MVQTAVQTAEQSMSHSLPLGGVVFITIFIVCFGAFLLWLASVIGRINKVKYDKVKSEIYECGIPEIEKTDTKISVKFYLTAILFILFDIEIIFMYPWAVTYRTFIESGAGMISVAAMGMFMAIFIFGLWWEVKSKALEWD
ncbi:MAG: NADH-quinone oxidoreductase subunit A [Pseudobdellovibrionaceae bacterium]